MVLKAAVERADLGKVLDLTEKPHSLAWNKIVRDIVSTGKGKGGGGTLIGDRYHETLDAYLGSLGQKMDDYDTIIGPNYGQGGKQICIKSEDILNKILASADEVVK